MVALSVHYVLTGIPSALLRIQLCNGNIPSAVLLIRFLALHILFECICIFARQYNFIQFYGAQCSLRRVLSHFSALEVKVVLGAPANASASNYELQLKLFCYDNSRNSIGFDLLNAPQCIIFLLLKRYFVTYDPAVSTDKYY